MEAMKDEGKEKLQWSFNGINRSMDEGKYKGGWANFQWFFKIFLEKRLKGET